MDSNAKKKIDELTRKGIYTTCYQSYGYFEEPVPMRYKFENARCEFSIDLYYKEVKRDPDLPIKIADRIESMFYELEEIIHKSQEKHPQ